MKLVRYGKVNEEKPGLIDEEGRLRDLSGVIADIGPGQLGDEALAQLRKLETDDLPEVKSDVRLGCPVTGIGKFMPSASISPTTRRRQTCRSPASRSSS